MLRYLDPNGKRHPRWLGEVHRYILWLKAGPTSLWHKGNS